MRYPIYFIISKEKYVISFLHKDYIALVGKWVTRKYRFVCNLALSDEINLYYPRRIGC